MARALAVRAEVKIVNRVFFRLMKDRSGATAIEYGLIVALVTLVIVTTVTTVGNNLSAKFNTVATKIAPAA